MAVDIVSSATPLSADFMHGGLLPDATILDTFVGNVGGCIGEISALALLLGALRPSLVWLAFLLSEGAACLTALLLYRRTARGRLAGMEE